MFLGYSEADETLLKPHNNLSVIDIPSTLQQLLIQIYNKVRISHIKKNKNKKDGETKKLNYYYQLIQYIKYIFQ